MARLTLDEINALDRDGFLARLGGVAEHSPWVAEAAFPRRPFASLTALHAALTDAIAAADEATILAFLNAHPDLAGRAAIAGDMTDSSKLEQSAAGLDRLTAEEMARFQTLNRTYVERFGFPFIMAVRYADKGQILAAYGRRVGNGPEQERTTALAEIGKIVWMRLLDLVQPAPTGRLTVHVLDTAAGQPAAGMSVGLFRFSGSERAHIRTALTNADGRLDGPMLAGADLEAGRYELEFDAGPYFQAAGHPVSAPPFLDRVPIRFAIANPEQHYHVPLLVSPWSYSTYRGS